MTRQQWYRDMDHIATKVFYLTNNAHWLSKEHWECFKALQDVYIENYLKRVKKKNPR